MPEGREHRKRENVVNTRTSTFALLRGVRGRAGREQEGTLWRHILLHKWGSLEGRRAPRMESCLQGPRDQLHVSRLWPVLPEPRWPCPLTSLLPDCPELGSPAPPGAGTEDGPLQPGPPHAHPPLLVPRRPAAERQGSAFSRSTRTRSCTTRCPGARTPKCSAAGCSATAGPSSRPCSTPSSAGASCSSVT